jgi:uncharacterized protein YjbJ (UPF0337 family)
MHSNEVKGAGKEILGSTKQPAGRVTDRPWKWKGAAQRLAGKIQKGVGRLRTVRGGRANPRSPSRESNAQRGFNRLVRGVGA